MHNRWASTSINIGTEKNVAFNHFASIANLKKMLTREIFVVMVTTDRTNKLNGFP